MTTVHSQFALFAGDSPLFVSFCKIHRLKSSTPAPVPETGIARKSRSTAGKNLSRSVAILAGLLPPSIRVLALHLAAGSAPDATPYYPRLLATPDTAPRSSP